MAIIIDLVLLSLFIFAVILGRRRGFIRSVMGLASFVLSGLVAVLFSSGVASLFEKQLTGFFSDRINDWLLGIREGLAAGASDAEFLSGLPESFTVLAGAFGIDSDKMSQKLAELGGNGEEAIGHLSTYIAEPIGHTVALALSFLLLFLAASIVCRLIFRALNLVAKMPVLHAINSLGGALIGIVYGFLWVWILCFVLSAFGPTLAVSFPSVFSVKAIHDSVLYTFFAQHFSLGMLALPY